MHYFYDDEEDQDESLDDRLWHICSGLSTEINLALLDLTEFPEQIFDYPQVTILRFGSPTPMSPDMGDSIAGIIIQKTLLAYDLANQLAKVRDYTEASKTIGRLSDRISELTNLVELDLTGQQLTELPESICDLPQLKRLYLKGNQLTTLPRWFSRLTSLVCLDIRKNPIQQWPEGFWEMPFIQRYKGRLNKADRLETELSLKKEFKAAVGVRRQALRWGLHQ